MRILLAIDGSEASEAALRSLSRRPWPTGSTVRMLAVVEYVYPAIPEVALTEDFARITQQQLDNAEALIARLSETLAGQPFALEKSIRRGDARTEIVQEAEDWNADLIIVGSHGRTGIKRWVLGSVAESVVRHAPCSVEVVRSKPVA